MADTDGDQTTRARPQKIEGATATRATVQRTRESHARWYAPIAAALVVVAGVAALAYYLVGRNSEDSPEAKIEQSVGIFVDALAGGDLQTLRSSTCGPLGEFYRAIPADQFADVYAASKQQRNVPVVDSVDAVQVTGDKAIAQVTAHTEKDAGTRTARTLNLENSEQGWKVCDPPA